MIAMPVHFSQCTHTHKSPTHTHTQHSKRGNNLIYRFTSVLENRLSDSFAPLPLRWRDTDLWSVTNTSAHTLLAAWQTPN